MRAVLTAGLLVLAGGIGGADDKEEIEKATKDLKSKDVKVRLKAVESLAGLGAEAARPLCDALLDKDTKVASAALISLERVSPVLYKPISALVLSKEEDPQSDALKKLAELGDKSKPALNMLAGRFKYELYVRNPGSRQMVESYYSTIKAVGAYDRDVVDLFKSLMSARRAYFLWSDVFKWLVTWAGENEERRKELVPLVKERIEDKQVAIPYIRAAGDWGALSKDLLPALKPLKLSSDEAIRDAATEAVKRIEVAKP